MIDVLELVALAAAVATSMSLAWRAVRELVDGAREAAHGATDASKRLWAYRLRIFTLTGLAAVSLGVLAAAQYDLAGSVTWWVSGGLLAFGALAYVSARASGRASRRGDKREHVRARLRFMRWQRQQRDARRGAGEPGRGRRRQDESRRQGAPRKPSTGQQTEVRRALRTLGLSEGATDAQIKRAWREKALRHHPDRHPTATGDASTENRAEHHAEAFLQAQRAYQTLTDRNER